MIDCWQIKLEVPFQSDPWRSLEIDIYELFFQRWILTSGFKHIYKTNARKSGISPAVRRVFKVFVSKASGPVECFFMGSTAFPVQHYKHKHYILIYIYIYILCMYIIYYILCILYYIYIMYIILYIYIYIMYIILYIYIYIMYIMLYILCILYCIYYVYLYIYIYIHIYI